MDYLFVELLDTMITENQLEVIGLNPEEAAIYHALLHGGSMSLQSIARTTGLKRTTLYPYIQSLIEKRITTSTPCGKRIVYSAEQPERLLQQLNERRYLLEAMLP